jgi:hypothetical protein
MKHLVTTLLKEMKSSPTSAPKPHTRAWFALEENLDVVGHFIAMGRRDMELVRKEATRFDAFLKRPYRGTKVEIAKRIIREEKRYAKTLSEPVARFKTVMLWELVILVTCVEAYLQDVLVGAASVDRRIMRESEQSAAYADVMAAASLDDLAIGLRVRWARGWLSDGGPRRWIKRLDKMGARGYPNDLPARLELLWESVTSSYTRLVSQVKISSNDIPAW